MNFIAKFFHELRNPHCEHCLELERMNREDKKESQICNSCEALKLELAKSHELTNTLIQKMTEKPEVPVHGGPVPITRPKTAIPWNTRRQMLEEEDRKKAELLRSAPKPITPEVGNQEIEKELGVEEEIKGVENAG